MLFVGIIQKINVVITLIFNFKYMLSTAYNRQIFNCRRKWLQYHSSSPYGRYNSWEHITIIEYILYQQQIEAFT